MIAHEENFQPEELNSKIKELLDSGKSKRDEKKFSEALEDYNQILKIDSSHYHGYLLRGVCYHSLKKPVEAFADYSKCIELFPDISFGYQNRVVLYKKYRDSLKGHPQASFDLAIADYNMLHKIEPRNNFYSFIGSLYKQNGDFLQAAKNYLLSIKEKEDAPKDLHKKAKAAINMAIKLDPENHENYYLRGQINKTNGAFLKASRDYMLAIEKSGKTSVEYYDALASLLRSKLKMPADASKYYTKAINIKPTKWRYVNRALSLEAQNKNENAFANYDAAIKLDPDYSPAYYARGLLFAKEKKFDKAVADYKKALENPKKELTEKEENDLRKRIGLHYKSLADEKYPIYMYNSRATREPRFCVNNYFEALKFLESKEIYSNIFSLIINYDHIIDKKIMEFFANLDKVPYGLFNTYCYAAVAIGKHLKRSGLYLDALSHYEKSSQEVDFSRTLKSTSSKIFKDIKKQVEKPDYTPLSQEKIAEMKILLERVKPYLKEKKQDLVPSLVQKIEKLVPAETKKSSPKAEPESKPKAEEVPTPPTKPSAPKVKFSSKPQNSGKKVMTMPKAVSKKDTDHSESETAGTRAKKSAPSAPPESSEVSEVTESVGSFTKRYNLTPSAPAASESQTESARKPITRSASQEDLNYPSLHSTKHADLIKSRRQSARLSSPIKTENLSADTESKYPDLHLHSAPKSIPSQNPAFTGKSRHSGRQ